MIKGIKVILVLIMLLFIAFAISNFFSMKIKAVTESGTWVQVGSDWVCKGDGSECGGFEEN